jgi:hypothetical protein
MDEPAAVVSFAILCGRDIAPHDDLLDQDI